MSDLHCHDPSCPREPVIEIRFDGPAGGKWLPMCQWHYEDHLDSARDTNEHEMKHFGGAFGLVSWKERPVPAPAG